MQINLGDAFGGNFAFEAQGQLTTWAEDEARAWKSVPWLTPEQATMFADRLEKFAIAMKPYFGAQSPIKLRRVRALLSEIRPISMGSVFFQELKRIYQEKNVIKFDDIIALERDYLSDDDAAKLAVQNSEKEYSLRIRQSVDELLPKYVESKIPDAHELLDSIDFIKAGIEESAKSLADIKAAQHNLLREVGSSIDEAQSLLEQESKRREQEWKAVREAYEQKLNLEATGQLWRNRATAHKTARSLFAKGMAGALALTPVVTAVAAWAAFSFAGAIMSARADKFALERLIFGTSATVLILTLCLWSARILVRLMMTEHHLAIDADSRAALGDTYIRLTAEGDAALEDRKIVLATMFRPVSDGIVNDDGLPFLSPAAVASSLLTGEKVIKQ
jgi:hypothetical protein